MKKFLNVLLAASLVCGLPMSVLAADEVENVVLEESVVQSPTLLDEVRISMAEPVIGDRVLDYAPVLESDGVILDFCWEKYDGALNLDVDDSTVFEAGYSYTLAMNVEVLDGFLFHSSSVMRLNGVVVNARCHDHGMYFGDEFVFGDCFHNVVIKNPLIECRDLDGNLTDKALKGQSLVFNLKAGCGKSAQEWFVEGISSGSTTLGLGSDDFEGFTGDRFYATVYEDVVVDVDLRDGFAAVIDPNGGSVFLPRGMSGLYVPHKVRYGASFSQVLPDVEMVKESLIAPVGKAFDGWMVDGVKYEAGASLHAKKNVILYPVWRDLAKDEYFISNSDSANVDDIQGKRSIVFNVDGNQVVYDEKATETILGYVEAGSVLQVELNKIDVSDDSLNDAQRDAIVSLSPDAIFSIDLKVTGPNGDVYTMEFFDGGTNGVSIAYQSKYDHSIFHVYRVEPWGQLTEVDSYFKAGQLHWGSPSHSFYVVTEEEDVDFVPGGDESDPNDDVVDEDKVDEDKVDKDSVHTSVSSCLKSFGFLFAASVGGLFVLLKRYF